VIAQMSTLGHRQPKGAATDKPTLLPPRHISTYMDTARFAKLIFM